MDDATEQINGAPKVTARHALAAGWSNGSRRLIVTAVTAAAALFVLSAVLVVLLVGELRSNRPWDPLGEYPVQEVTNGPKIPIAATVHVTATKCADVTVDVRGSSSWASVTPPGTIIPSGQGAGQREAGCTVIDYENRIPDEVAAVVRAGGSTVWRIVGTETPFEEGREGVPRAWRTEDFEIVP